MAREILSELNGNSLLIEMLLREKIRRIIGYGKIIEYSSFLTVGKSLKNSSTTSLLTAMDSVITVRNEAIQLSFLKWEKYKERLRNNMAQMQMRNVKRHKSLTHVFNPKNYGLSAGFLSKKGIYG